MSLLNFVSNLVTQIVHSVIYSKLMPKSCVCMKVNVAFDRLTNCRMGSVEVMETFCYNLGKNTSLVELRCTMHDNNNGFIH